METPELSANKRFTAKQSVGVLLICLSLAMAMLWFYLQSRIENKTVTSAVRPAVKSVYRAYLLSRITGAYWENEMVLQSKHVSGLALNDRLSFYRAILLNCDLDTSRAHSFAEIVSNDAVEFRQNLNDFLKTNVSHVSDDQRRTVKAWIEELRILSDSHKGVEREVIQNDFVH
jgi:hypothetical protein